MGEAAVSRTGRQEGARTLRFSSGAYQLLSLTRARVHHSHERRLDVSCITMSATHQEGHVQDTASLHAPQQHQSPKAGGMYPQTQLTPHLAAHHPGAAMEAEEVVASRRLPFPGLCEPQSPQPVWRPPAQHAAATAGEGLGASSSQELWIVSETPNGYKLPETAHNPFPLTKRTLKQ